jgi:hypothetical protein
MRLLRRPGLSGLLPMTEIYLLYPSPYRELPSRGEQVLIKLSFVSKFAALLLNCSPLEGKWLQPKG